MDSHRTGAFHLSGDAIELVRGVNKALAYTDKNSGSAEPDQRGAKKDYQHRYCDYKLRGNERQKLVVPVFDSSGDVKSGEAGKAIQSG